MTDFAATIPTDAGMWLLWQPGAFSAVRDYDTWAAELEDDADIVHHIALGHCVPVNIGQDMAAAFLVRVAEVRADAVLTDRETTYRVASSGQYGFVSHGAAVLSGIEGVMGGMPRVDVTLAAGHWAVTVHLIAWDEEPGMTTDGRPTAGALPDFVLLLNQTDDLQAFGTDVSTFPSA